MWDLGRLEDGLERMNLSFELLAQEEPDADLASLAAQLGRFLFFGGQTELGMQRIEAALEMAEGLDLPEVLAQALTTKGVMLQPAGDRRRGSRCCGSRSETATEHDKPSAALRASYNLGDQLAQLDRYRRRSSPPTMALAQSRRFGLGLGARASSVRSTRSSRRRWDEALDGSPNSRSTTGRSRGLFRHVPLPAGIHRGSSRHHGGGPRRR